MYVFPLPLPMGSYKEFQNNVWKGKVPRYVKIKGQAIEAHQ
jgi:hypothetical protein